MRYRLRRTQQLSCSMEAAWMFFSSPKNLARITPKALNFKVLTNTDDGDIYPGMEINYKVSPVMGIPLKWKTVITQVDPQKSFTDFQEKGPYKYWHHFHEFEMNNDGVLMKDTVDYELPFGVLGRLAHRLFVKSKLEEIFSYRYKVLEDLFNKKDAHITP